jgi:hypothetical protein
MCRIPTVRQLCSLLAAGWLAAGAAPVSAAAIAETAAPAASQVASATGPLSPSVPRATSAAAASPGPAFAPPAAFDALDQPDPQLLAAADSLTQAYLTPASFSRAQANDSNASRLHLPRQDPDLDSIDPYKRYPASAEDRVNPAVLWISMLGLITAAISGILQYARNPITRKRKYRNYDRPAP